MKWTGPTYSKCETVLSLCNSPVRKGKVGGKAFGLVLYHCDVSTIYTARGNPGKGVKRKAARKHGQEPVTKKLKSN